MASIDILNLKNEKVGSLELSDEIFGVEVKQGLMHSAVRVQLMNRRGGNASTKGRSEVRGGGAKPWKQKGTGRARAGTSSSPLWVGGGTVFGPQPKKIYLCLNKKVKKAALRSAVSMKFKDNNLIVLDDFNITGTKTKEVASVLGTLGASKSLIVMSEENSNLSLSARNLRNVKVMRSEGLNVYDIVKYEKLVVTKDTVARIEEVLGK